MSNWSKEDRKVFDNSEVMKELEKKLVSTAFALNNFIKNSESLQETKDEINEVSKSVDELNSKMQEAGLKADDDLIKKDDDEEDFVSKADMLNDLRELVKEAVEEGNYKVAYKIERTITELLEGE